MIEVSGIEPSRVVLELTEQSLVHDINETVEKMKALRRLGVRFSIDDFGTGYSSLSYLKAIPLDELKIDQSFVRDIAVDSDDAAIVKPLSPLQATSVFT
ncbi:EAL domain-containing protein [Candidatus Reidiella endopervernicosa]|uniref:EAL domain-containing protein n=1 Tax=Candidatus Reidiella endopervernicosa TaxID=2738883 RepID=A0A6N0HUQ1_9GAMM|nr:EAL domain-containing protein [Candidatus Reidiella endopervernicosa]